MPPAAEPGRRQRKRTQTLDHLAITAFTLFEAHGFDVVTMEQIAAAADVAKGTLYNHFPVKEALLAHQFHAEFAQGVEQLRDQMAAQSCFADSMGCLLGAAALWCESRRAYLPHYFRYRLSDRGRSSGSDAAFGALIAAGQQSGELRDDLSAAHLAALFKHLYFAAMLRWLCDDSLDVKAEFAAIIDLFVNGASRRAPS